MFHDDVKHLISNTTSHSSPDSHIGLCVSNTTASPELQIALSCELCSRHDHRGKKTGKFSLSYCSKSGYKKKISISTIMCRLASQKAIYKKT